MKQGPDSTGTIFVGKAADPTLPVNPQYSCIRTEVQTVQVPVNRFAGLTDTNGHLVYLDAMIDNGLTSANAKLDVYASISYPGLCQGVKPEDRLKVTFNGVPITTEDGKPGLTGGIGGWGITTFNVPMGIITFPDAPGVLRLPRPGHPNETPHGEPPEAVQNIVEVTVDQDPGDNCFCVRVGWASLEVKLASPLILVQANNQKPAFWMPKPDSEWTGLVVETQTDDGPVQFREGPLVARGLVPLAAIYFFPKSFGTADGDPTGSEEGTSQNYWEDDAVTIAACINAIADSFGSDYLNAYGHSMGGLSLRGVATDREVWSDNRRKLISVMTAGSPHEGSPVADIGKFYVDAYNHTERDSETDMQVPASPESVHWKFSDGYFPPDIPRFVAQNLRNTLAKFPGLVRMTTGYMREWNDRHGRKLPRHLWYYAAAADADRRSLDDAQAVTKEITQSVEFAGFTQRYAMLGWFGGLFGQTTAACNAMYQIVGRDPVIAEPVWLGGRVYMYAEVSPVFQQNDMFDTVHSALGNTFEPYFFERVRDYDLFQGVRHRDHALISVQEPMPAILTRQVVKADQNFGGLR